MTILVWRLCPLHMSIDLSVRDPESESARRFYVDTAINNFLKHSFINTTLTEKNVFGSVKVCNTKVKEFDFGLPFL